MGLGASGMLVQATVTRGALMHRVCDVRQHGYAVAAALVRHGQRAAPVHRVGSPVLPARLPHGGGLPETEHRPTRDALAVRGGQVELSALQPKHPSSLILVAVNQHGRGSHGHGSGSARVDGLWLGVCGHGWVSGDAIEEARDRVRGTQTRGRARAPVVGILVNLQRITA